MTDLADDYWDRPEGWTLEDAAGAWVGPNPEWGTPWAKSVAESDPDDDFVHDVAALIETVADAVGFRCLVEGIDDTALGLVINSDKTFAQFLAQHKLVYNYQISDIGSSILVRRPLFGGSLVLSGTLYERHCVTSGNAPAVRITRVDPASLPREFELQYISADRDLAVNSQLARIPGANANSGKMSAAIDFVIYDQQARDLAFDTLRRIWSQAVAFEFEHNDLRYEVGDVIALETTRGTLVGLIDESSITPSNTNQIKAIKLLQVKGGSVPAGHARPKAPVNDNFADAIELTLGVEQPGTNRYATTQTDEPDHAGSPAQRSVWYVYSSVNDESINVTIDPGDDTEYRLAVYTGSSLDDLTEVDSATGGSPSISMTIDIDPDTIYYIAVDGVDGAQGQFAITVRQAFLAGAGSYALTGTSASIDVLHVIDAGASSYALSGDDVGIVHTIPFAAGGGSYLLTGSAAALVPTQYTTFDPTNKSSNVTLSGGNLIASCTSNVNAGALATHAKNSGKWYFEVTFNTLTASTDIGAGVMHPYDVPSQAASAGIISICYKDGVPWHNGASQAGTIDIGNASNGTVLCVSVDLDNDKIWYRFDAGNWNGSGTANPATNTEGLSLSLHDERTLVPAISIDGSGDQITANFGASSFAQTPPSGFGGWTQNTVIGLPTYADFNGTTAQAITRSNSNRTLANTGTTSAAQGARSPDAKNSGKWYVEVTVANALDGANCGVGVGRMDVTFTNVGNNSVTSSMCYKSGNIWSNGSNTSKTLGSIAALNTRIDLAIDLDNRKIWFRKNGGNWNGDGTADPATNTGGISSPANAVSPVCTFGGTSGTSGDSFAWNFGQSAMSGGVPSGFTSGWPLAN